MSARAMLAAVGAAMVFGAGWVANGWRLDGQHAAELAQRDLQALAVAERIGYPVLVRPSYVLGGRGMEIIYDAVGMEDYLARAGDQAGGAHGAGPLLIDRFLDDAIEIDVDALYDGTELFLGGVMEHIEEAGIHSGDSACVLPPMTLSDAQIGRIRRSTEEIARGVGVRGLINIQFALLSTRSTSLRPTRGRRGRCPSYRRPPAFNWPGPLPLS